MSKLSTIILLFWLAASVLIEAMISFKLLMPPQQKWQSKQKMMKVLLLTDYCLSTESRHTRHFTMPDYFAPFQDTPAFYEHFPSSSFFPIYNLPKNTK
jgi:hypothetical protein